MLRLLRNLILIVLTLVILALAGLATPPGRAIVAGLIERAASANGLTVSITAPTGWPPFWFGADRITIADGDGVFAEIDSAAIDVRALALLTGGLAFDTIDAGRVAIARRPDLPGGGGDGALLPFAAEKVSVARLELGPQLAGRPAVLALNGSFISGSNGSIAATVNAERIDGIEGTLTARIDRTSQRAPLAADINVTEADNGILVGLMGRLDGPGYTLAAQTGFNGDAVAGDLTLTSDGAARFAGRFTLSPAGAGRRLVLSGAGDLAELVPPGYEALLSGAIDVAIDADWTPVEGEPLPQIVVRQGTVSTASLQATASGSLAPGVADLAVTVNAALPGGARLAIPGMTPPTSLDAVSLSGRVVPSGDVVRLEVTGRIGALAVGETTVPNLGISLALEAQQNDPLAGGTLPFALRLEADALATPGGRVAATPGMPLVLAADGTYDTGAQSATVTADVSAAGGMASFAGTVAADGADGQLRLRFDDVSPLGPFAGRALAGAIDANADGRFGAEIDARVSATTTNFDPGDPTLARLMTGTTALSGGVRYAAAGTLAVSDLSVDGEAFDATGNLALTADTIQGTLAGGISDLALFADASTGAADFTARISGAPARPVVDATIAIASGRLLDQPVDNATVNFKGAPNDTGWSGTLSLSGGFAGGPLAGTATAVIDRTSSLLSFPDVNLSVGDNRITGSVERTGAGPLSGTLSVDAPNLRSLAALALIDAAGSAQAEVLLTPDGERQSMTVSFVGSDVGNGTASARRLRGEVEIADAFGAPQIRGNATGSAVTVGAIFLDSAEANATVENGATLFSAQARGPDLSLTGSGRLSGDAGAQTLRIDTLNGTAYRFPVALNQPVTIDLAGGASRISGATLTLGGGTVRIDGAVAPNLDITVAAERVAASVANAFSPRLGAEGAITGRARVTGTTAAPQIAWQANWAGLSTAATRNARLPGLTLSATGNANRTRTSVDATVSGAGLTLSVTGGVPFAGSGLDIRAQGTAPLALLALESARELRVAGNARMNLTVTGAMALPRIAGAIDLADATFADTSTGLGVTAAGGRINFDGQRATIQTLTGRLLQGGDVTVTGSFSTAAGLPADLAVRVANGRYNDGQMINTAFNADLTIRGPLTGGATLAGTVALSRTEIQLPDRIGGAESVVAVKHVNAPPGFVPPQPRYSPRGPGNAQRLAAGSPGGLNLDVAMTGAYGIFVRGFGIDAELGGQLRLAGTTGSPQAIGGFQMVRGRIEVVGRRFDFTRGQLTFAGDLVPVLDFAATTSTRDAVVTLTVTGPANDPDIVFTSSPQMPEEEILARLLFNQSVGRLTPFQAVQLVDAVAQLTGVSRGGGIVSRIRQATGLDDLDIRQSATGGTVVGLGRRINERLRVGVEAGTNSADGRVVIDLDITDNLKAQAEAGQDGRGKVGLTYEREY